MVDKIVDAGKGLEHIHRLMHVFIEGIAAGVYDSVEDAQQDAKEYLAMEKAVEKLSKWNKTSEVNELAEIFDGISHSINCKKEKAENEKAFSLDDMPKLGEEDAE